MQSAAFIVHKASDALAPKPPRQWLVDSLISVGNLIVMAGDGGTKKTWLMLTLAVCLAGGIDWAGWSIPRPIRTLYVDEELGLDFLEERIAQIIKGYSLDPENLEFKYTSFESFDLTNKKGKDRFEALIMDQKPDLVIIDALVDVMSGMEENAAKDTHPVMKFLNHLTKKTGVAIIIVHHTTKNGNIRGSSAIPNGADTVLLVTSTAGSNIIRIQSKKVRHKARIDFKVRANFGDDTFTVSPGDGEMGKRNISPSKSFVIDYIYNHGPSMITTIMSAAEAAGYKPGSVRQVIYSLIGEGLIGRVDGGSRGESATVDLLYSGEQ